MFENHGGGVANYGNDATYNIDSKIYKWDGSVFVEFQSIATNGAIGFESFTLTTAVVRCGALSLGHLLPGT